METNIPSLKELFQTTVLLFVNVNISHITESKT